VKDQNGGQCGFTKQDGTRCEAHAMGGSGLCFFHDPDLAKERTEARRAGGRRNKAATLSPETPDYPLKSVANVAELLASTINQVRRGALDPRNGNTVGYLAATLLRALEAGSLEARVIALEAATRDRRQAESPCDFDQFGFRIPCSEDEQ
jgi:hypothetical protein